MRSWKKYFVICGSVTFLGIVILSYNNCGKGFIPSSSMGVSSRSNVVLSSSDALQVGALLIDNVAATGSQSTGSTTSSVFTATSTLPCKISGTMALSGSVVAGENTITYNNCVDAAETKNGTVTISMSSSANKMTMVDYSRAGSNACGPYTYRSNGTQTITVLGTPTAPTGMEMTGSGNTIIDVGPAKILGHSFGTQGTIDLRFSSPLDPLHPADLSFTMDGRYSLTRDGVDMGDVVISSTPFKSSATCSKALVEGSYIIDNLGGHRFVWKITGCGTYELTLDGVVIQSSQICQALN